MATDPAFPNRPDHPFFWEMSAACIDLDTAVDSGASLSRVLEHLGVHTESCQYVAEQRLMRLVPTSIGYKDLPTAAPVFLASWLDGFTIAMRLIHNRLPEEGQHRG